MIENLLVITDQNENETVAIEKAFAIAAPFNPQITVMTFISTNDDRNQVNLLQQTQTQLQNHIDKTFGVINRAIAQVVATDNITSTLKVECENRAIDLVLKTGHRTEGMFHTPLDWHLIRELPCPILIAAPHKWKSKPTILATLDVEKTDAVQARINEDVLTWSKLWSDNTGNCIKCCYTIPVSEVLEDMDIVSAKAVKNKHEPIATKKMIDLLDTVDLKNSETHITTGNPAKEIPSYANKIKADLVIMGSIGRKGVEGMLLGNTAEKILHHLHTDTLIIRPRN